MCRYGIFQTRTKSKVFQLRSVQNSIMVEGSMILTQRFHIPIFIIILLLPSVLAHIESKKVHKGSQKPQDLAEFTFFHLRALVPWPAPNAQFGRTALANVE
jgi:hypothetical protein